MVESLHLVVVPGVSAVIPLKGSGTHFRKQEDSTYHNITALQLKKNAKPYKPLLNILRGTNVSHSTLLTADCSGRVQVDLLSGLQPSFHFIQVSSQTQTCLHTPPSRRSCSHFSPSFSHPPLLLPPPSPKAKNIQAGFSITVEVSTCLTLTLHCHPPFLLPCISLYWSCPWSFLLDLMRQYPTDHCCGRHGTKLNNPTPWFVHLTKSSS